MCPTSSHIVYPKHGADIGLVDHKHFSSLANLTSIFFLSGTLMPSQVIKTKPPPQILPKPACGTSPLSSTTSVSTAKVSSQPSLAQTQTLAQPQTQALLLNQVSFLHITGFRVVNASKTVQKKFALIEKGNKTKHFWKVDPYAARKSQKEMISMINQNQS